VVFTSFISPAEPGARISHSSSCKTHGVWSEVNDTRTSSVSSSTQLTAEPDSVS